MSKANNKLLRSAAKGKNDEFYTQLTDIEKEAKEYKEHFKDKIVYCNCDDPSVSQFFHYFSYQFETLGLKKLITTSYKNDAWDMFSRNNSEKAVYLEYDGDKNNNKIPDDEEIEVKRLKSDGDFRSDECIEILKQADIVVTNPPFSLFREYVAQLIKYEKKFLIIGNVNAITYKEIFALLKANKIWLGHSIKSGDREFGVPDSYPLTANSARIDENGKKFIRVKGVRWWTNLDYKQRYEDLFLHKEYNPDEYPHYDNYNAINVDETKNIPKDWDGYMGVPITFLDKYNPNQFELLGIMNTGEVNEGIRYKNTPHGRPLVNGVEKYLRVLLKKKK